MAERNDGGERLREEDMLIEVLSKLDVKTLLQCKAVSKAWYSLISSPVFIKSHLNQTDNKTVTLIVRLCKDIYHYDCPIEDGSYSLFELDDSDDFKAHLGFPYSKGDYFFMPASSLIGCVCGIVCVYVDPNVSIDDTNLVEAGVKDRSDIYIWNPATKQSKLIPKHALHNSDDDDDDGDDDDDDDDDDTKKAAVGFGFDPIDFDFKVVRVVSVDIFPEVYSVNRNIWRKIETKLGDVPYRETFEICLHGFLFTIGHFGMMAFDLNKEVFICDIKLPDLSDFARLADFKDSIAVIIFFEGDGNGIKLWTLDDEACLLRTGVEASWTMMLTINVGIEFHWVYGLFNNVEVFVRAMGEWFSYNLDKKVGRYVHDNPFFDFDEVFKYTESLLPVAGSKLVNWSDAEDGNEESCTDSEEVSEESSVYSEDDDERISVGVGSEDDNEESTADSEDSEESSVDSEDDNEESSTDSEEVSEESSIDSEDDDERSSFGVGSEDDNEESTADSEDSEESSVDFEDDAGDE